MYTNIINEALLNKIRTLTPITHLDRIYEYFFHFRSQCKKGSIYPLRLPIDKLLLYIRQMCTFIYIHLIKSLRVGNVITLQTYHYEWKRIYDIDI